MPAVALLDGAVEEHPQAADSGRRHKDDDGQAVVLGAQGAAPRAVEVTTEGMRATAVMSTHTRSFMGVRPTT